MWKAISYILKILLQPQLPMAFRLSQFHVLSESSLSVASSLLDDGTPEKWVGPLRQPSRGLSFSERRHVAQISLERLEQEAVVLVLPWLIFLAMAVVLEAGDFLTGEESSSLDPCSMEFVINYVISFSHVICSDKSPTS